MKRLNGLILICCLTIISAGCGAEKNTVGFDSSEGNVTFQAKVLATALPEFTVSGNTLILTADITTDETIQIPDGFTLDGKNHTITAVDPAGGHFIGGVIENAGTVAHVKNLTVTTSGLANVGDGGADRLRGIMFEGASGSITHCNVIGINQGASGAQEGNGIEVRNAPFDGTHPNTVTVEVAHNVVDAYQKTGIVANGDVDVSIHHNRVGESATQENLAPNGIQLGFGAIGAITQNQVEGNEWLGVSNFAATAILVFAANDGANVSNNVINNKGGNADVGILFQSNNGTINNNKVFDNGPDGPHGDFGVADLGTGNAFTNNKVRGYDNPHFGVTGGKNKAIPGGPKAFIM